MLKFIKIMLIVALVLFVVNCTKAQEDKQESEKNIEVKTEKVTDTHKESHDHKEGELCIDPVAGKVAAFSMEGKYEEAIQVLVEAKDVPGYQWDAKRLYDSIIYLYDKTKQYEKNLDIWRDAHSKGLVFKMDKTKKHFEPYLKLEGFDDIYAKDLEMQGKAVK